MSGHGVLNESQIRQTLEQVPFWGSLPSEFFDFWLTRGRVHRYAAKQYLYFSGDDPNAVFVLLNGRIQLLLTTEFSEKILRVLGPSTFFPEVALDGKPYPQAALSLENSDVLSLDTESLKQFLQTHPALLWLFYRSLALDVRRSYRQIKNLSLGDARLRLGAKLFALAHAHGQETPAGVQISIPLSATELAAMCSLARESVSRILGELKQSQIIHVEKKEITIPDLDVLSGWIRARAERNSL
ncbi:RmlC-like jelly roll fold [Acididesulfobacillus acetoxydans]|uniref:RmlC-like jelly roll fold n=1 Tax=Acididesulfobacillus acetoxydans TaxID=1561005 RepID=A0A8S0X5S4_9FIRM|nr:Crp/Fnr family transcriptional regulator [Acididesulfobacillus acetoxydans]CAA7601890.1 RmlC-like jelly roll fold [Acididesulfobacillus acetoxydans]CEJ08266.1 cAMP-binding protein [Acididesulfobacillus acetoxydans]